MANIKVMGDTVQICSSLTVEDIRKAKFYKPSSLELRDENGEAYFGVGVGNAHYGKNGIMFSSCDHEGKAFMTTANPVTNDHSNRIAEQEILIKKFAGLINNLNKIEDQVIAAFDEITDIEAETASSIVFVDDAVNISIDEAIFEDICAPSNPPTTEGEM